MKLKLAKLLCFQIFPPNTSMGWTNAETVSGKTEH